MTPPLEAHLDVPMPLAEHLIELRERLILCLLAWGVAAAAVYRYSGAALSWLVRPAGTLVFLAPTEAFMTRLKVGCYGGFMLAFPFIFSQAWLFVARAFDKNWRRKLVPILPASFFLFLLGSGLCLTVVVPAAMRFLLAYGTENLKPLLSLGAYLDFALGLALSFGLAFQLPLVLYLLNQAGLVSRTQLASWRRPAYFLCFVSAAFLTPGPDVISQASLALPAALLYELSLLLMRRDA
ncbi:MAG: twin-arginine translocase subunit TatC [Elusimicrobia bacterium]|nr:twin-arginine translocase subunit TatC [Elusimicrobiota bacterium]